MMSATLEALIGNGSLTAGARLAPTADRPSWTGRPLGAGMSGRTPKARRSYRFRCRRPTRVGARDAGRAAAPWASGSSRLHCCRAAPPARTLPAGGDPQEVRARLHRRRALGPCPKRGGAASPSGVVNLLGTTNGAVIICAPFVRRSLPRKSGVLTIRCDSTSQTCRIPAAEDTRHTDRMTGRVTVLLPTRRPSLKSAQHAVSERSGVGVEPTKRRVTPPDRF